MNRCKHCGYDHGDRPIFVDGDRVQNDKYGEGEVVQSVWVGSCRLFSVKISDGRKLGRDYDWKPLCDELASSFALSEWKGHDLIAMYVMLCQPSPAIWEELPYSYRGARTEDRIKFLNNLEREIDKRMPTT